MSNPEPIELDITVRDDASVTIDAVAEKSKKLEQSPVEVAVDTTGVPAATEDLEHVETIAEHIANSPAVLDIQTNFAAARGDLEQAETHLGKVREAAGSANGEIAGMAGNVIAQVPGIDGATAQMSQSLGQVAQSAESLGGAATGAGTVAALAFYGIEKGADQAADRTDNLTKSFGELAKASDAAFTQQAQQVWADAILRSALDGKKLTEQMKDLAETSPAVARRMLDNADAIGLNANAQKILTDAIAANEAETAQAKKTNDEYGDSAATAAGKTDGLTASTAAAGAAADISKISVGDYVKMLATIPPDKRTEIAAAIAAGDIDRANALLNSVTNQQRTAVIDVAVRGINIGAQIGAMVRAGAAAGGGQVVSITNVNLPAGARGIDALREVTGATRRSGSRYGSAAVSRARR